jgi:acetyl-CoA carboxylase biotin carboxyl carrier protein
VKLTAADIAEITKLLDESHFANLKLEIGDFKLKISRGGSASRYNDDEEDYASPAPSAPAAKPAASAAPSAPSGGPGAGEVDVPAPLLGNFYSAPRPGDDPFVQPGDKVSEDTTIGIIEVMKLMNPIRAGVVGTVVAVLAQNGAAIEEGQALIRVKVD